MRIPIVGTVAAGLPLLADQNIDDYVSFPAGALHRGCGGSVFMLRVKGDSMINAGIYHGDKIIVEQCDTAENGDIVVALVEDSATVKRFFKEKGTTAFSRKMMLCSPSLWTRWRYRER